MLRMTRVLALAGASLFLTVGTASAAISSVTFGGTPSSPVITITGTNLGTQPAPSPANAPDTYINQCTSGPTGNDGFDYGTSLYISDTTGPLHFNAGRYVASGPAAEFDCIGLVVTSFSQTQVTFTLGSYYGVYYNQKFAFNPGDSTTVAVNGATATVTVPAGFTGTVPVPVTPPPTITITSPANGSAFKQGQAVAASYSCAAPAGVTVTACTGTVANGAALNTSSLGAQSFTVNATDSDGQTATQTVSYTVSASGGGGGGSTALMTIPAQTAKVSKTGKLAITVTCANATCTGSLKLTTVVKTTTGTGANKKTKKTVKKIGTATFTGLAVGTDHIFLKLNGLGRNLLRKHGYKLSSTATVKYASGSTSKTATGTVSLKGTKPKKH